MSCIQCGHCPSKAAESAEQLSEALLEDLLEDTECRLQAPTLDSMLFRMEEIQVRATNRRARRKSARNLKKSLEIVVLFIVNFGPVMLSDAVVGRLLDFFSVLCKDVCVRAERSG